MPESCDGVNAACPADGFVGAGTLCRASTGLCDNAEACTGSSPVCPADALAPPTQVCRAAAGTCDIAETCTGTTNACPVDARQAAGAVCRAAAGLCDADEICNGTAVTCPADAKRASTVVCRAANGTCDVAERCTGTTDACPADAYASMGSVCRASTSSCDPQEVCSGANPSCPADLAQPPANCAPYACTGAVGCVATCLTSADCADSRRAVCVAGQCRIGKLVFLTSVDTLQPSFGGLAAGDTICQDLATDAGIGGTYRAWLSTLGAGNHAKDRITHHTVPFVLTQGKRVVATDWTDLTDGMLQNSISADERGVTVPTTGVFTGTTIDGTATGNHCANWSTTSAVGTIGNSSATNSLWTSVSTAICINFTSGYRLYCFEQ